MKAYIVASGVRIEPFDELVRDLPVGNVSLSRWQADLFRRFGVEPVFVDALSDVEAPEPYLLTYDNVFFTRRVLKSFLKGWKKRNYAASQLALPVDSTFIATFSTLADFTKTESHALFNFWGAPAGKSYEEAEPLEVIYKEKVISFPVPRQVTGIDTWEHPITTSVCLHLCHWIHVLQANRLAIQVRWVDTVVSRPFWISWVLLCAAIPTGGRFLWRLMHHANIIGKNVDIHPTARVEGCIIGDNVTIGAQTLVRASLIGDGATLEDRCNVAYSVIGEKSFVSKYTLVYSTVCFEEANLGMSTQMCLLGRRAAVTPRATPIDVIPGRKIKVKVGDRFEAVDLAVLGSCYGNDTFIGADIYIGPGRQIPNGTRIGPQPGRVLMRLPDKVDPERFYVVRDGALEEP